MMKGPKLFLAQITRTGLGLVGAVITTVSALLIIALLLAQIGGRAHSPYAGIIAFLVLPTFFALGLLLIPLGLWRDRVTRRRAGHVGPPVIDLGSDATRRKLRLFVVATLLNVAILIVASLKGVETMETTQFCGGTCHTVMRPEFTAYKLSPHARVRCVDCHIGPGASWFVKSKLSGSWQVIAVLANLYPRPIPTPIKNLRPARETCEQCHWPTKFVGDRLKVIDRFQEDEKNTDLKTVLLLKVGGRRAGKSQGIHWHVSPDHEVRYRADAKRSKIYEVEKLEHGKVIARYRGPDFDKPEAKLATTWRTMDCVDCHNRPAHTFRAPDDSIDRALAEGLLDRTLPFIKREGLKAVKQTYPSQAAARAGIRDALVAFYSKSYPNVTKERVAAAAKELGDIYSSNVFPDMKIGWNTYPNQLGHLTDMGCLRCHNGDHKDDKGETIPEDCDTCHTVLADSEEHPDILKTLEGD